MSAKDDLLNAAKTAHDHMAPGATDAAVQAFMANLGESRCPSPEELQSAMNAARSKLRDVLFNRTTIQMLVGRDTPTDDRLAAMKLSFNGFEPPLKSPPLPACTELPPMRLPLAAMLGAVLGALIGSPVGLYFLAMRDVGLLVGAPLGALVVTWALDQASRSAWLSRTLIATLGVATAVEVWAYLSVNPLAAIWQKLSGRKSLQRIVVYLLLIALLVFTRRRATYERAILEQSVRQTIDNWLHGALVVLVVLIERRDGQADGAHRTDKGITELGKRIMELHAASADKLPGLAQEVIDAARDAGFEGLDGLNASRHTTDEGVLTWVDSMRERYGTFGHIEAGDMVRVEQEPVVRDGEVLEKGLVRKQRGG